MRGALAVFGWRDALDILLVAVVIYRVFVMFKGTRAVQMLVGLGALMAASPAQAAPVLFWSGVRRLLPRPHDNA